MSMIVSKGMSVEFDERSSDSPFVETIWYNRSEGATPFLSLAVSHWQMVVTRLNDEIMMTVRGPETHPTQAYCPPNAEFFGILFKYGSFMPHLPSRNLVDGAVNLPDAASKSFWLQGSAWEFPTFDNADIFVNRLVREGLLVHDPVIASALRGHPQSLSPRSVERRFLQATGLTQGSIRQIERARHAASLLKQGLSILDTVAEAGYADQPHLTRSLKHFIGQTPAQVMDKSSSDVLSLLFNTMPFEQIALPLAV